MKDTTFVALAIVLSIIITIAFFVIRMRLQVADRRRQLAVAYSRSVREAGLTISYAQQLPGRIIAFDNIRRVLLYLDNGTGMVRRELIPLSEVAGSRVVTRRGGAGGASESAFIQDIVLSLSMRNGAEIELPVFSGERDGIGEQIPLSRAAEHWQLHLRKALGNRKPAAAPELALA